MNVPANVCCTNLVGNLGFSIEETTDANLVLGVDPEFSITALTLLSKKPVFVSQVFLNDIQGLLYEIAQT